MNLPGFTFVKNSYEESLFEKFFELMENISIFVYGKRRPYSFTKL